MNFIHVKKSPRNLHNSGTPAYAAKCFFFIEIHGACEQRKRRCSHNNMVAFFSKVHY